MPLGELFNRIYAKQDLEELEQAAQRLNTLIQLQSVRAGHAHYVDYRQTVKRIPMHRDVSFELDRKIIQKTNEIMRKLWLQSPDLRSPSMQEIIHFELMALEMYKERLQEKRFRRSHGSKVSTVTTRSSMSPRKRAGIPFKDERAIERTKSDRLEEEVEREVKSQMISTASQTSGVVGRPLILGGKCVDDYQINDLSTAVSRIHCVRDIHAKLVVEKTDLNDMQQPRETAKESIEIGVEKEIPETYIEQATFNFNQDKSKELLATDEKLKDFSKIAEECIEVLVREESPASIAFEKCPSETLATNSFSDAGDAKPIASQSLASPLTALTNCTGMTVKEALYAIKQNSSDNEIVLLISPLPGESLRESPLLQITLFNRWEKRILGSFQIPDKRLGNLDAEGIFKMYPVIFLSTCIMTVQHNINMIVDHLSRITRVHPNHDDIDRLFELAESYDYRIYARPDYGSYDAVYVCDFYTSKNAYIGTTRLYGTDVLGQLRRRPNVLKNFELIVELNDRIVPKKIKEVIDTLLARLSLTKIYERVGMILFKIFRKFA